MTSARHTGALARTLSLVLVALLCVEPLWGATPPCFRSSDPDCCCSAIEPLPEAPERPTSCCSQGEDSDSAPSSKKSSEGEDVRAGDGCECGMRSGEEPLAFRARPLEQVTRSILRELERSAAANLGSLADSDLLKQAIEPPAPDCPPPAACCVDGTRALLWARGLNTLLARLGCVLL